MLEKLADLDAEHAKAVAGGGEKYVERHHARGKLMPRERIELLVDPGSAFLELSPLAGWGSDFTVGASVVTGIGVIEGVECMITANDPSVKGGASNPWTVKKIFRASQIAEENNLPTVALVESGGADLPTQKEIFIPGGRLFRDITRSSARKVPTIALVFGNSTAGGAYVPGMSDYTVMVKEQAKVFLGGPPLVKMATGEESDDESLGGAEMHARTSGLADYLAVDEHDALRIGRRIVARLNKQKVVSTSSTGGGPASFAEPEGDVDDLLDLIPSDLKEPFDPRQVIALVADGVGPDNGAVFDEFKPLYGSSLVTGWAKIHGHPVGILANAQGVLFSEEAQKATQFIQLANQVDTPLLFLHNTTGYMVGARVRAGRDHQARRPDDQRGQQQQRPSSVGDHGCVVRRRELRHERPRLRPTVPVHLAQREVGGDGPRPARRCALHRRASSSGGSRTGLRRRAGQGDARVRRGQRRGAEPAVLPLRHALRRRCHRPARHPHRARPLPLGDRQLDLDGCRGLRGVPAVTPPGITRLLVANRGEIARRVFATCRRLGIETVAVHSDADAGLPFVREADVAVRLPGNTPAETYLRADLVLQAARRTGADSIHPGYGFLSENAAFARAVIDAGLTWVGPSPESIEAMGSKVRAKELMRAAGVPVLEAPGRTEAGRPAAPRQGECRRWRPRDAGGARAGRSRGRDREGRGRGGVCVR